MDSVSSCFEVRWCWKKTSHTGFMEVGWVATIGKVVWRIFCSFWAASSKRFWLKSCLEGCAANLVPPTSSGWGVASALQHGSLDHAQKAANENPDWPWANSSLPWNRNQVCLPIFWPRLRNSQSVATAPLERSKQAGFKLHRLMWQEIAHSKARRRAEIYTSKERMAPPNSLQVWREGD